MTAVPQVENSAGPGRLRAHVHNPTNDDNRLATVDIVIPVHNEQYALPGCLSTLQDYLRRNSLRHHAPFLWTITVVDNASTDDTLRVAHALAANSAQVRVLHLSRKGRGHALRTAWSYSDADVVAYMDVDLSTGLDALFPLVAPLINGHSDIAIGSRLAPGARTVRSRQRELISRAYNATVRWSHGAHFSDAQCGFKAARTKVVRPLLDSVADDSWFFDTELLLVAEFNGLRVHEVPVDWVEDTDSRVDIVRTAADDLAGLLRVTRAKVRGTVWVSDLPRRPAPAPAHPQAVLGKAKNGLLWQLVSFGLIGAASTVLTAVVYAVFRTWWPPLAANLAALLATTVWNTNANRRYTFSAHDEALRSGEQTQPKPRKWRTQIQGLLVFALYYALTSGALLALHAVNPATTRTWEVAVLVVSSLVGTALRFVLLRFWVFRRN